MNSFIFIFDREWRRVVVLYALWTLVLGVGLAGAVIGLDPYDSGHYAVFGDQGVPHFGQRLADAGVARNPHFDIAIIGNSTVQLLDPAWIGATPHQAASLAIPGTGPREQLAVAAFYLRHHPRSHAIIFGIDDRWCDAHATLEIQHPFPFWLYGDSRRDYLSNMLQMQGLGAAMRKLGMMLGSAKPNAANGYNDYDAGRDWSRENFNTRLAAQADDAMPDARIAPPYNFPAIGLLKDFLATVPRETKIILIVPPQYRPVIGAQQQACEAGFAALIRQRPHAYVINFLSRRALTDRDEDYWDRLHYRARVARAMEKGINGKLR